MTSCTIIKEVRFEAAHQLPNHSGKCARPHGHSYRAELAFFGPISDEAGAPDEGMVLDFDAISTFWKSELEPQLDHRDLNAQLPDGYHPTTAEHVALFLYDSLADGGFPVVWVRVWETATGSAIYGGIT